MEKHYLSQKAGGALNFKAPRKEGKYEFRMFEKSNGKEVATLEFSVKY
jgi:hypothetical protein